MYYNITKSQSLQQSIAPYVTASARQPAAAAQPPPLVAALYRRALADGMPVAGTQLTPKLMAPKSLLASYYLPPADSAKAEAALVLKLCCIRRIILKQNKKKTHDQMNSIGPPIYMIYTHTTHRTTTTNKTPGANRHCCPD